MSIRLRSLMILFLSTLALKPVFAMTTTDSLQACADLDPLLSLQDPTTEQLIRRGELRIQCSQDYEGALMDAQNALAMGPMERTRRLLDENPESTTSSLAIYESALKLGFNSARRLGMDDEALQHGRKYLELEPRDYKTRWETMISSMNVGDWASAKGDALILISVPGGAHYENYLVLARANRALGDEEALANYTSATLDQRAPLVVHVEKAELQVEMGDLSGAVDAYQGAIQRLRDENILRGASADRAEDSFPPEWRLRLAQLMKALRQNGWRQEYIQCIASIDKLQAITKPSALLHAFRARAAWEMGQYLRAESDAIRALTLADPNARTQAMGILEMILTVQDPEGVGQLWDHTTTSTTQCLTMGNRMKGRLLGYPHENCSDLERQWTGYDLNHDGIVDIGDLMLFPKVVKALEPPDPGGETTPLQGSPPRVLTETEYK